MQTQTRIAKTDLETLLSKILPLHVDSDEMPGAMDDALTLCQELGYFDDGAEDSAAAGN